jgi:hypothetical protein
VDWKLEDKSTPGVVLIQFKAPGEFKADEPLIHFVAFGLPTRIDPAILVNVRKARFAALYQAFEVLVDEKRPVGAMNGRRFVFRRDDSKTRDRKIKTTEFLWTGDRSGYLLNLIAPESTHDAVLAQFDALLASFETVEPAAKGANEKAKPAAP